MRVLRTATLLAALATVTLAGCINLSGLDARSSFTCKAPEGVLCDSMTGVYTKAEQQDLPGQRVRARVEEGGAADAPRAFDAGGVLTRPIDSGTPIRTAPRVLRVWFSPWEDSDGDLHDQSYVYLPVDSGRWLIEHSRRRIQDAFQPVRPPSDLRAQPSAKNENSGRLRRGWQSSASASEEVIGSRQDRPGAETAAELMSGIGTPGTMLRKSESLSQ